MKKFITIAQVSILITHIIIIFLFKIDRNRDITKTNKEIVILNNIMYEVNTELEKFNGKIDSLYTYHQGIKQ